MIHQYRDKKRIARRKNITRIIIILVFFILLSFTGVFTFFEKLINYIGHPIWEAKKVALDEGSKLNYITRSKSSLSDENKILQQENSNLKISMIDFQILEKQNNELKELLKRIPSKSNFILSAILTKPNHSPYDTLIIDVGSDYGILEDLIVYINGNIPIGVIRNVYKETSLVELYSNPEKITPAVIDELNIGVDLIGRGGGNFEILVPLELEVPEGSIITLPGLKSEILAISEEEISDSTDPNKKIILSSPINIQNEKWVQVRKN